LISLVQDRCYNKWSNIDIVLLTKVHSSFISLYFLPKVSLPPFLWVALSLYLSLSSPWQFWVNSTAIL
jgi:hypothetical protein